MDGKRALLICMPFRGIVGAFGAYEAFYEVSASIGSTSTISWIGTMQAFLLIVFGIITGPIFEMGYFRVLLFTGCFLIVFGLMMLSLATEYWQIFLAQALCIGLGNGCLYVPSLALVSTAFTTKRALAIGIATSGSSVGGVIYPIIFRQLQPRIGFAWVTRVIGFITLFIFMLAILLFHLRPFPMGPKKRRSLVDSQALKDVPFLIFTFALLLIFMGYWIPFFYQIVFAEFSLDQDPSLAFNLLSVTNAGSFFGRILPAFVATRFGPMRLLMSSSFAGAILILCWMAIHNLPGFIVFCVLWGFCSGILASIPAAIVPLLSPSMDRIGTRMGMAWTGGAVGILIGSPIAGAISNPSQNNFTGAQALSGSVMALGTVLLFVPWRHIRSKANHA